MSINKKKIFLAYSLPNISDMNIPRRIPNSFSRIK